MTAEQHLKVLEEMGEIKVNNMTIIVFADDDDEIPQVVSDYVTHFSRKGYTIIWR